VVKKIPWCLIVAAVAAAPLHAHRLEVDYFRAGREVKVEVFYPGDGSPAREAAVTVADANGTVIAEGVTGEDGAFTFTTGEPGPFTVTAMHGAHDARAEISPGTGKKKDRREPLPALRIVAGLGLIFGGAGFLLAVLAWRRTAVFARRLAVLEGKGGGDRAP
jgi:hypothetical protein